MRTIPAANSLPSDWIVMDGSLSPRVLMSVVTLPPVPKEVSSVPFAL